MNLKLNPLRVVDSDYTIVVSMLLGKDREHSVLWSDMKQVLKFGCRNGIILVAKVLRAYGTGM